MNSQKNKIPLSKKDQRELTSFIGHELLYDYNCENLDQERKRAVEEHLKYSADAQLDLAKIQTGESYLENLSRSQISSEILEEIKLPASYFSVLRKKTNFERWPLGFKWGLEALVMVAVIILILSVMPWQKLSNFGFSNSGKDVVLAEISRPEQKVGDSEEASVVPSEAAADSKAEYTQETTTASVESTEEILQPQMETATPSSAGFLYRTEFSVTNLEAVNAKIVDKIIEIGGRKAGSVELGWSKTVSSRYYHFTIPQAKYDELVAFMSTYGKFKLKKEQHPRVMPEGIIRLIITANEGTK